MVNDKDLTPRDRMVRHAMRRLWQRQGIALSGAEYDAIAQGIRAGLYRLTAQGAKGCLIYEVAYRNKTVYAVWTNEFDCVKTFLPCRAFIERNFRGRLRAAADRVFVEARAQ
jgi:hypothetical protein